MWKNGKRNRHGILVKFSTCLTLKSSHFLWSRTALSRPQLYKFAIRTSQNEVDFEFFTFSPFPCRPSRGDHRSLSTKPSLNGNSAGVLCCSKCIPPCLQCVQSSSRGTDRSFHMGGCRVSFRFRVALASLCYCNQQRQSADRYYERETGLNHSVVCNLPSETSKIE